MLNMFNVIASIFDRSEIKYYIKFKNLKIIILQTKNHGVIFYRIFETQWDKICK